MRVGRMLATAFGDHGRLYRPRMGRYTINPDRWFGTQDTNRLIPVAAVGSAAAVGRCRSWLACRVSRPLLLNPDRERDEKNFRVHRTVPSVNRRSPAVRLGLDSRDQARRVRLLACRDAAGVRLLTRNGNDFTARYPLIVEAVNALPVRSCVIDARRRRRKRHTKQRCLRKNVRPASDRQRWPTTCRSRSCAATATTNCSPRPPLSRSRVRRSEWQRPSIRILDRTAHARAGDREEQIKATATANTINAGRADGDLYRLERAPLARFEGTEHPRGGYILNCGWPEGATIGSQCGEYALPPSRL
jgi:hypothetical protein